MLYWTNSLNNLNKPILARNSFLKQQVRKQHVLNKNDKKALR